MKDLTLIIPAKEEAESLPVFLNELKQIDCKKLIVLQKDDLKTINVVKKMPNIEILEQINKGYGNALIEGIDATKTKYCCIINADGSMNSKYLSEMHRNCQNKDLIFATRYQKSGSGSDDDDIITFVGNKFFTALGNIFFNLKISDILFTYILGKTDSFKKLQLKNSDFRICVEIPIKAKKLNLNYDCTSSFERVRIGGKKKVNPAKDGLLILFEMIRLFFKKYF
jgi:glycosyltransferase involved in cell wall biosynthesis|tara:strand:+ start:512 stop:1186 length:675 start_codon:yes stop_codon:yes gene_type:complete